MARGSKKPGMPSRAAEAALNWFCHSRVPAQSGSRCGAAERDEVPELLEPVDAPLRRVAGDQRGVDGADRHAGDPVDLLVALVRAGVDAGLVGAQGAAPLQH